VFSIVLIESRNVWLIFLYQFEVDKYDPVIDYPALIGKILTRVKTYIALSLRI